MQPSDYPHLHPIIGVFGEYEAHDVLAHTVYATEPLDEAQSWNTPHVAVDDFNNLSVFLPGQFCFAKNSASQQLVFHEFAHLFAEHNKRGQLDGCSDNELEAFAVYCEIVGAAYGELSASITWMRLREVNEVVSGLAFELYCYFGADIDRALNDIADSGSMNEVAESAAR